MADPRNPIHPDHPDHNELIRRIGLCPTDENNGSTHQFGCPKCQEVLPDVGIKAGAWEGLTCSAGTELELTDLECLECGGLFEDLVAQQEAGGSAKYVYDLNRRARVTIVLTYDTRSGVDPDDVQRVADDLQVGPHASNVQRLVAIDDVVDE